MFKRIQDLTEEDKKRYYEATKEVYSKKYATPWPVIEKTMLDEIDKTFDDEAFSKMDPDFAVDAAYARKEFGKKKPSLVDYMLWMGKFVTNSDEVEIPD